MFFVQDCVIHAREMLQNFRKARENTRAAGERILASELIAFRKSMKIPKVDEITTVKQRFKIFFKIPRAKVIKFLVQDCLLHGY